MASRIRVDTIAGNNSTAVTLGLGATIPSGYSLTCAGNMSLSGVCTASNFVGNGSGISGIPVTTVQKVITFSFLG